MNAFRTIACIGAVGALVAGCATPTPQTVPAGWNAAHRSCKQLELTAGAGTNGPGPAQVYHDCMKRKGFDT